MGRPHGTPTPIRSELCMALQYAAMGRPHGTPTPIRSELCMALQYAAILEETPWDQDGTPPHSPPRTAHIWQAVQPDLGTDGQCVARYTDLPSEGWNHSWPLMATNVHSLPLMALMAAHCHSRPRRQVQGPAVRDGAWAVHRRHHRERRHQVMDMESRGLWAWAIDRAYIMPVSGVARRPWCGWYWLFFLGIGS